MARSVCFSRQTGKPNCRRISISDILTYLALIHQTYRCFERRPTICAPEGAPRSRAAASLMGLHVIVELTMLSAFEDRVESNEALIVTQARARPAKILTAYPGRRRSAI
jgi:hypothetical protein